MHVKICGLTNLDVLSLLQDRTGFLWVGTDNGLYRYDGRHFRMFGNVFFDVIDMRINSVWVHGPNILP